MKIPVKFTVTVLSGLILAACSNGGGSANKSSAVKPAETKPAEVKPAETKPAEVKPTETKPVEVKPAETTASNFGTGAVYVLGGQDNNVKIVHKTLNDADNLNFIKVDGKSIRVAYQDQGIFAGAWSNVNDISSCCGKFNYMRFGVSEGGPNDDSYLFYNGQPTKNVPTTGQAEYLGKFLITGNTSAFDEEDYLRGNATFNVDFGTKKLTGSLTQEALQPINVEAKLSGNSFIGNASSKEFNSQAVVEGKFFGDNAKEVGGLFKDKANSWGGAFGASK